MLKKILSRKNVSFLNSCYTKGFIPMQISCKIHTRYGFVIIHNNLLSFSAHVIKINYKAGPINFDRMDSSLEQQYLYSLSSKMQTYAELFLRKKNIWF